MSDNEALVSILVPLGVLFMLVGLPVMLFFRHRARGGAAAAGDVQARQALFDTARRMEARIEMLEHVLDSEAPGWRSRSGTP